MATWQDMSLAAMKAARLLAGRKNHRSAINRAYYAAFSAMTNEIRKRTHEFPRGYEHPPHVRVGSYIKRFLTDRTKAHRDELRDAMARLYAARVEADYRHESTPTDREMGNAMVDALYIMESVGVI
ncbi:HEPN domain-containing protein [Planctomycetales bacterium ZRK34]|nr:HEPN domain-containing protein [Planctomycetales bacterium ZRK34]